MKQMTRTLKMPSSVCGLALGFATLGNLLALYGAILKFLCGCVAFSIIAVFTVKVFTDLNSFKKEFENPIALSVLPTYAMTLILLTAFVKPAIPSVAFYAWMLGILLYFALCAVFMTSCVRKFALASVFPSWFIPTVGIVTVSITAPAFEMRVFGQAIFYIGFALYWVVLILVLARLLKARIIPEPALPTFAIFAAPMSLCLVGYLSCFEQKSLSFVFFMLAISSVSYLAVLLMLAMKLIWLKFYPTFAAFTFPFVISASAFIMADSCLKASGIAVPAVVYVVPLAVAVVLVAYVFVRYCLFWLAEAR
jgi:exfoliative toxin A/B